MFLLEDLKVSNNSKMHGSIVDLYSCTQDYYTLFNHVIGIVTIRIQMCMLKDGVLDYFHINNHFAIIKIKISMH